MLKMNELARLSNTPKSTVQYYVKEGLLPEPLKDKPNFHLYDAKCVERLALIKYLQTNFNATISQIKTLFADETFDADNPFESLLSHLAIIMGAENAVVERADLCAEFQLSEAELDELVAMGLLFPRAGQFSTKEREILAIFCRCDENERALIRQYLQTATQLAALEVKLGIAASQSSSEKNAKLKHLFDVLLVLKPYLFNLHTFNHYQSESAK